MCGHHHLYSTLARGMPAPPKQPAGFGEILEQVWWRLDTALEMIYSAFTLGDSPPSIPSLIVERI